MDSMTGILLLAIGIPVAIGIGFFARNLLLSRSVNSATSSATKIMEDAETEYRRLIMDGKEGAMQERATVEREVQERRREIQRGEDRLDSRDDLLNRRQETLEQREGGLVDREEAITQAESEMNEMKSQHTAALESAASMSVEDARKEIIQRAEGEMKHDLSKRFYELEQEMLRDADEKAKKIISESVQRLAAPVVAETTTSLVPLPNDEMKGRLIGREGRNIRAIEAATGVDLIVDDTPEAVTISCFDPIRREIAKIALERLVKDGRIHPTRIEESVEKAQTEVEESIRRSGEQAVLDSGVRGLHPELVNLLGKLNYRYSYGENVLQHSVEVARLAGLVAGEMKVDIQTAKAGGLLHDIGKALTHESEGSHIELGDEIADRFGLSQPVRDAIAEHHEDERGSPESFAVAAADAMSAARPGARRDTAEFYLQRLEALEDVANSFEGVQRSYAIQAGREVRIFVQPDAVDDVEAANLAHNVVKKIQENLVYPGHIKVTVVRETRASEVAH